METKIDLHQKRVTIHNSNNPGAIGVQTVGRIVYRLQHKPPVLRLRGDRLPIFYLIQTGRRSGVRYAEADVNMNRIPRTRSATPVPMQRSISRRQDFGPDVY